MHPYQKQSCISCWNFKTKKPLMKTVYPRISFIHFVPAEFSVNNDNFKKYRPFYFECHKFAKCQKKNIHVHSYSFVNKIKFIFVAHWIHPMVMLIFKFIVLISGCFFLALSFWNGMSAQTMCKLMVLLWHHIHIHTHESNRKLDRSLCLCACAWTDTCRRYTSSIHN